GISVNMSDSSGRTPLHVACSNRNMVTAFTLLHMGAPVNVVDNLGNTPLTLAAISGSANIVLMMLEAGADPRLAN
ncbi:ankyrin, partial [Coemansia reversa NRRL 1564]